MPDDFPEPHLSLGGERILLAGGDGYLGRHFQAQLPAAAAPPFDVADPAAVRAALDASDPRVLVNCAGRCGTPNVDWCEDHPAETVRSNVTGPLVLLDECVRRGVFLVHLSSGCLYQGDNGSRGFAEDDPPTYAGSLYSRTKGAAEQVLREFPVLILRPRLAFDGSAHPRNLLTKLRRYPRLLAEPNSLTYVPDLVRAAAALIAKRATGVYHVVNLGAVSPLEVMRLYRERVDPAHRCEPLPADRLAEVARAGRSSCVLCTARLERAGVWLPPVREALAAALRDLAAARAAEPHARG